MNNRKPGILIVDNYDSFTFNLVQVIREYDKCDFFVEKSDKININDAGRFGGFLFSPGPGIPDDFPVMAELLKAYGERKSFLGVCLGFQSIAEYFGMKLEKLNNVRHGIKARIKVEDPADYVFKDVPSEFDVGLYHSWGVLRQNESCLRVTALGYDGVIMAIAHNRFNIRGVQFHPESYLTEYGALLVRNWINNIL